MRLCVKTRNFTIFIQNANLNIMGPILNTLLGISEDKVLVATRLLIINSSQFNVSLGDMINVK